MLCRICLKARSKQAFDRTRLWPSSPGTTLAWWRRAGVCPFVGSRLFAVPKRRIVMRTRTLITGAALMAAAFAGVGTASAQQALRGSDTLENLTEEVIANCPGATGNIVYVGGGSGAGQSAMAGAAPTQRVAPMSRQLNGAQCTANSRQILIALDGLSILAKNSTGGNPATCTDDIGGAAIALTGIPATFIPCTTNTQCASVGTTCDTARQFCVPGGTLGGCTAAQ